MTSELPINVAAPPSRPLMIWDGECHFCGRWIERWKQLTQGRVDYIPSQQIGERFPEIPREMFRRAVVLVDPNGHVFSGAEAVYRSLGRYAHKGWLEWCYDELPAFGAISETAYRFISKHRDLASRVTRLLWGRDVCAPTYFIARRWFLRMLGVVYLIAFLSLWVQVDGLLGSHGISSVRDFLPAARQQIGAHATFFLPTLFWLNSSDAALHWACGAGTVVSLLLIAGFAPILSLIVLFVLYLSLTVAGQTFLQFQWDILLLETGFLAIFFAPPGLWLRAGRSPPLSRIGFFLLRVLLFKLMFMSGAVKLTSYKLLPNPTDDTWWNLTALNYHFWTQPLPTPLAWWAAQTSQWLKQFCTAAVLIVETLVPFLIWTPRRPRFFAFVLLITLQVMIALTGNYCFFNLLTITLCLLLLDDYQLSRRPSPVDQELTLRPATRFASLWSALAAFVLVVTLPVNVVLLYSAIRPELSWPKPIASLAAKLDPFHIVNGYGLFRVMTTTRPEIVVEGSVDGIDWKAYEFKWKPGAVDHAPRWAAPHQPRLDWQMWFAALGSYHDNPWFVRFMKQLLNNSPAVTGLLASNPFGSSPPRYVRATLYQYRFTTVKEREQTGAWWVRERSREYFPEVSLIDWEH